MGNIPFWQIPHCTFQVPTPFVTHQILFRRASFQVIQEIFSANLALTSSRFFLAFYKFIQNFPILFNVIQIGLKFCFVILQFLNNYIFLLNPECTLHNTISFINKYSIFFIAFFATTESTFEIFILTLCLNPPMTSALFWAFQFLSKIVFYLLWNFSDDYVGGYFDLGQGRFYWLQKIFIFKKNRSSWHFSRQNHKSSLHYGVGNW